MLEILAAFVHGALAAGHVLGIIFNVLTARRLRDRHAFIHLAALLFVYFDVRAAIKHARRARQEEP